MIITTVGLNVTSKRRHRPPPHSEFNHHHARLLFVRFGLSIDVVWLEERDCASVDYMDGVLHHGDFHMMNATVVG